VQQLTIKLENSLTQQFPNWMDVVRASVYDCGRPFKAIAADIDMSVSELSRRLSPVDTLSLSIEDLPRIMRATGDIRPLHWLVESFIEDDDSKQKRVVDQIAKLLPQIQGLLNQVRS
jgi:hypothetical protein